MSWWSRISGKDAYKDAQKMYERQMQQSQQQYNQAGQTMQPYVDQGQQAYGNYNTAMQNLMNPSALQDEWMKSYAPSEQAKYTSQMAGQQGLDAASAMGVMGSTPAMQAVQAGTSQIMADDKQRYLDQLMQKYMAGAGIAGNIYNTGVNAAGTQTGVRQQQAGSTMQSAPDLAQMRYGQGSSGSRFLGNVLGGGIAAGLNAYGLSKLPTYGTTSRGTA